MMCRSSRGGDYQHRQEKTKKSDRGGTATLGNFYWGGEKNNIAAEEGKKLKTPRAEKAINKNNKGGGEKPDITSLLHTT